jgi:5-methyltetrahydrofolate corrinoid/iron sulfur protein methyltransferase
MIFIGERINGSQPHIYQILLEKNKEEVQKLARKQTEAGAAYLDLNVGTAWLRPAETMVWLVKTVQEAVPTPLALDSRRIDVIEAGIRVCKNPALINSTTGEKNKLPSFMDVAVKHQASIIALTMDEQGIPPHAAGRVAIAKRIMEFADGYGLPRDRLFIDPVLLPLKFSQSQGPVILEAIREIANERVPPHIIVGLSNSSQGAKGRQLINRTFLAMAMACGLDAVIGDVLDGDLVKTATMTEVILECRPDADQILRGLKK